MATVMEVKERTIADIIKNLNKIQEDVNDGLGRVFDETSEMSVEITNRFIQAKVDDVTVDNGEMAKGNALKDVAGKAAVLRKRIAQDIALMLLALEDAEDGRNT